MNKWWGNGMFTSKRYDAVICGSKISADLSSNIASGGNIHIPTGLGLMSWIQYEIDWGLFWSGTLWQSEMSPCGLS